MEMMKYKKKILIATGGTGGHIFPAYSLAKHFLNLNHVVHIATDERGYKFLVKEKKLNIKIIKTSSIFKKNFINKILSFFRIIIAIFKSMIFLYFSKTKVVFGMGGYSSFPICFAAIILRIPIILYESNLFLGKTNKFLLPYAKQLIVAYSELEGVEKKYISKMLRVGNIIRKDILEFKYNLNLINQQTISILILGGSQAAQKFGKILPEQLIKCKKENINVEIYQQCLKDQELHLSNLYNMNNIKFELFNFTNNLIDYFSKTNLVITRSGSSIIAELINCKIPFITIPLPSSADNHQLKNSRFFEKKGCNFVIEESDVTSKLFPLIKSIHKDRSLLHNIVEKHKKYSDREVFNKIDEATKELLNEKY